MHSINVEGLPEPTIKALEALVEILREGPEPSDKSAIHQHNGTPRQLPVIKGKVIGSIRRRDIYERAETTVKPRRELRFALPNN